MEGSRVSNFSDWSIKLSSFEMGVTFRALPRASSRIFVRLLELVHGDGLQATHTGYFRVAVLEKVPNISFHLRPEACAVRIFGVARSASPANALQGASLLVSHGEEGWI